MQRGTLPPFARVEFHVPCRRDLPAIVAAGDLYLAGSEGWWCELGAGLTAGVVGGEVRVNIERISAVTLKVASMANSVRFYRDVLGMQIIYGGEEDCFSSFRMKEGKGPILNLEQGHSVTDWGRLIFYVADVDAIWAFIRRVRRTLRGANDIFICPIRMATSCRLHVHCDLRGFSPER